MRQALIVVVCMAALVTGCHVAPSIPQLSGESYQVPVVSAKDLPAPVVSQEMPSAPAVEQGKEEPPTLTLTIPPSSKPTVVQVRQIRRSIIEKAMTNKPQLSVKTDNPGVKAYQPKKTVWWRWVVAVLVGLVVLILLVSAVLRKVMDFSLWGVIKKAAGW